MIRPVICVVVIGLALSVIVCAVLQLQPRPGDDWLNEQQRAMSHDLGARIALCEKFVDVNGIDPATDEDLMLARYLLHDYRTRKPYKFVIERIEKTLDAAYKRARIEQE